MKDGNNVANVVIKPPTTDWNVKTLYEEFQCFNSRCNTIFYHPLTGVSDEEKVNYLMMWMDHEGECILWSLSQEPKTKPEEYYTALRVTFIQQVSSGWQDTTFHNYCRTNLNLFTASKFNAVTHGMNTSSLKKYIMKCFWTEPYLESAMRTANASYCWKART